MLSETARDTAATPSMPSTAGNPPEYAKPLSLTWIRGDKLSSFGGAGSLEISEVVKILENSDICSMLVGICALNYYGAPRIRLEWEVCVPTSSLDKAAKILKSEPYCEIYETYPPGRPQLRSLFHTFPRFKMKGVGIWFTLIPAEDAHLDCVPSNVERSQMGLPYPKLPAFAQSLLETQERANLTDLIDAMDLTEEWGSGNLDLDGSNDISWAQRKNEKIRSSDPWSDTCFRELDTIGFNKKELWDYFVGTKEDKIGLELSKEFFATRFRARGEDDPRSTQRNNV